MPANRSRTERWRECLHQIYERAGGIEVAVARASGQTAGSDLCWRVRILGLSETEMVLERPTALNTPFVFEAGTPLTCVMAIGQNRWMFKTQVTGATVIGARSGLGVTALRVQMPEQVERCSRRSSMRVSTAELNLPKVECWTLLDPTTAVTAELANRAYIEELNDATISGKAVPAMMTAMPQVGPGFTSKLVNIGGGGAGLVVGKNESGAVQGTRLCWFRLDLTPEIPAPIAVSGRIVHTHIDSEQNMYCGVAFEFGLNPAHREFVANQLGRYMRTRLADAQQA